MTVEQAYNDFLYRIKSIYETREAANITDWVFENVTGLKRLERSTNKNIELKISLEKKLKRYLEELIRHKPVQYILNEAWFYKMKFFVNKHVLIPRPETEELVSCIINDLRLRIDEFKIKSEDTRLQILDIGTGSGCIAISLKKELTLANVFAIDVSTEALAIAKKNADTLNAPIKVLKINFLDEKQWNSLSMFDVITSNPPYIPGNEKDKLAKNVTDFEPSIALFIPDEDPFIFYKKILAFAQSHLKIHGKIYVEVHEDYAKNVKDIFENSGFKSTIKKDIYGRERMVSGIRN